MDPIEGFGVIPPFWGPPHGSHWGIWGHPTNFGVHLRIPLGIWGPLRFGAPLMIPYGVLGVPFYLGSTLGSHGGFWGPLQFGVHLIYPIGDLGSPPIWGPPHGSHWVFWGHPPPIPLPIPPRPGCGAVVNQIPHTSTQVGRNLPEHCGPPAAGGAISALMSN